MRIRTGRKEEALARSVYLAPQTSYAPTHRLHSKAKKRRETVLTICNSPCCETHAHQTEPLPPSLFPSGDNLLNSRDPSDWLGCVITKEKEKMPFIINLNIFCPNNVWHWNTYHPNVRTTLGFFIACKSPPWSNSLLLGTLSGLK